MAVFTELIRFLLLVSISLLSSNGVQAWLLPEGFYMTFDHSAGWELRWKSVDGIKLAVGGARPEFRLSDGEVFGYPVETSDGGLRLTVTPSQQEQLSVDGENLEVWSSGRRLDQFVTNAFLTSLSAASNGTYDSKPPSTPIIDVDPAAKGTYATRRLSYNLTSLKNIIYFPNSIEVLAEVTRPLLATGKRPLVLFLHGRHATCYNPKSEWGDVTGGWPCYYGYQPIPSYKGYRYVTDILASQGYITISISANGINGQDADSPDAGASARSVLIRRHLALWTKWNSGQLKDPWGGIFKGKVDMSKVVLVGHSRGGEGVNRAAVDASSSNPYKIVGIVTYGPTSFGRQVTPDLHSATILPTCDGDVSDLQGQAYIDESRDIAWSEALRSAVITIGCNHNYFNTEWTPGLSKAPSDDDWWDATDPTCGSNVTGALRLTPQEQQIVGAVYTCALVRLAVNQDVKMLPLLDGSFVKPKSIGRAEIAVNAVGGAGYRLLFRPEYDRTTTSTVNFKNGMKGNVCLGYTTYSSSNETMQICNGENYYSSPHWLPMIGIGSRPGPSALELYWRNRYNATATFKLISGNLTGFNSIDIRIANDPNQMPAKFAVWIRDKNGNNSTLKTSLTSVDGWPGAGQLDRIHARTFRVDLASVGSKVNLNQIVAVLLSTRSATGRVWVLDIAASKATIAQPVVLDLPVLSIPVNTTKPEGYGPQQANLTILADRPFKSPASIWVQRGYNDGYRIDIPTGSRAVQLPFSWVGDKIYSSRTRSEFISIAALNGATTGSYVGGLTLVNDDPVPTLSVVSRNIIGVEGSSLVWTFRLSSPSSGNYYALSIVPLSTGAIELSSADVDAAWLEEVYYSSPPSPPVPLSSLGINLSLQFGYGVTSVQVVIPLAYDGIAEGNEMVRLEVMSYMDPTVPYPIVLTGTVREHT